MRDILWKMQPKSHNIASRKVDATLRRMSIIYNRVKNVFKQHFTRYSLLVQVIFCQINILCHQFTQTWPLILSDLQQFFTNCSEIQNLQNLCFEFQNNCVFVNLKKLVVVFWVTWWQNMLICQRTTCIDYAREVSYINLNETVCSSLTHCISCTYLPQLAKYSCTWCLDSRNVTCLHPFFSAMLYIYVNSVKHSKCSFQISLVNRDNFIKSDYVSKMNFDLFFAIVNVRRGLIN